MKTKERLVIDQGLVLFTQLSCSKRCSNASRACCLQKIICKFPSCLKTNLLKVLLCLQVFYDCGVIEGSFGWTKRPLSDFSFL